MTTIDSFPTELIRHIITLAYPAEEAPYESEVGLGKTALVHSTWLGPSQSLLTERLHFSQGSQSRPTIKRFVEKGPNQFTCQSLYFFACSAKEIRGVIDKAQPGGIRTLRLWTCELEKDLLAHLALSSECLGNGGGVIE